MSRIRKGEINLDFENATDRFQEAFNELLAGSKKSADELWMQQIRGVVRNLFAVIPPMGGLKASIDMPPLGEKGRGRGVVIKFKEGKDKGKSTQESDIARAFQKAKKSDEDFLNLYLSRRTKLKRYRRFGQKINATPADIQIVKKNLEARQGITASGWLDAVQKLSVAGIPKWITRHAGKVPSKCEVSTIRDGYAFFEATNGTNHADSAKIEGKIAIAINLQAMSMERWVKKNHERLGNEVFRKAKNFLK
jgi:hypothetical protein